MAQHSLLRPLLASRPSHQPRFLLGRRPGASLLRSRPWASLVRSRSRSRIGAHLSRTATLTASLSNPAHQSSARGIGLHPHLRMIIRSLVSLAGHGKIR
jgi:hypothetical protein